jgi:hypothetical protein
MRRESVRKVREKGDEMLPLSPNLEGISIDFQGIPNK